MQRKAISIFLTTVFTVIFALIVSPIIIDWLHHNVKQETKAAENSTNFVTDCSLASFQIDENTITCSNDNTIILNLPMEEGFGTTTQDTSPYNNDANLYNTEWNTTTPSPISSTYSLKFNSTKNSYAEINNDPSLNPQDEITIDVWVLWE